MSIEPASSVSGVSQLFQLLRDGVPRTRAELAKSTGLARSTIAAVVVGGTLLVGGRGTITGTVFGVLIFATLTNVFVQNNLTSSVQAVAKGIIIVIAVLLQQRFAKPTGRST